jgi:cob(I)alamin adenosyltransferase
VAKDHPRVAAYGDLDEANAALGLAVLEADRAQAAGQATPHAGAIAALLRSVQHDLFDAGADLCVPVKTGESGGSALRVTPGQTERLERAIDEHNARLGALTSFVLPGGTALACALHAARTAVRRAERSIVTLMGVEPDATNPEALRYVNRLSDLLFVLGRVANADGAKDVLWVPGANRGQG